MSPLPCVRLRPGRDRSVRLRHPWVLSGSVAGVDGEPAAGTLVEVVSAQGQRLAVGDYDPSSQIRVRITDFTGDGADAVLEAEVGSETESWLEDRLDRALAWRSEHPLLRDTSALRLVHAEADGLPGLTVDRYDRWLVVKLGTPGMTRRAERIADLLVERVGAEGIWLRGEVQGAARSTPAAAPIARESRQPTASGVPFGRAPRAPDSTELDRALHGEIPREPVPIEERGRHYWVDLRRGQKTGFYLDQRDARDLCAKLSDGRRVLDAFAYTGGFSAAALAGGAREVVAVESSRPACALLERNAPGARIVTRDAFAFLSQELEPFDVLVLDPPPFARRKKDVRAAGRAYKDLHLRAFGHVARGAHVLTFTCSHHFDASLFRHAVTAAALESGVSVQVLAVLGAPPDHPVDVAHPQGEYLHGLLLRTEPRSKPASRGAARA